MFFWPVMEKRSTSLSGMCGVEDSRRMNAAHSPALRNRWIFEHVGGVRSRMSFGWFPKTGPSRISISGSNAGVQAGLSVWHATDLAVAVIANSWGRGSRSGELMDDGAAGLIGKLAAICDAGAAPLSK